MIVFASFYYRFNRPRNTYLGVAYFKGLDMQGGNSLSFPSLSQAQPNGPNFFQSQAANQALITSLNQLRPVQTNQPKPSQSLLIKQSPPIVTNASQSSPIILKVQPEKTHPNQVRPIIVTQTCPIQANPRQTGPIIIRTNPQMVTTASSQTQENIFLKKL